MANKNIGPPIGEQYNETTAFIFQKIHTSKTK
jgi:hypothetical protein